MAIRKSMMMLERRKLLKKMAVGGFSVATGLSGLGMLPGTLPGTSGTVAAAGAGEAWLDTAATDRVLHLVNVHTGEEWHEAHWSKGAYIQSALKEINHLLRDHRANEAIQMDPAVLDYLYLVRIGLNAQGPETGGSETAGVKPDQLIQILSGYRSPATNAKLARQSSGVASKSLHMVGRAIDFRVPGTKARELRNVAMKLQRGGVGYYEKSDFIHIDSGAFRHWG